MRNTQKGENPDLLTGSTEDYGFQISKVRHLVQFALMNMQFEVFVFFNRKMQNAGWCFHAKKEKKDLFSQCYKVVVRMSGYSHMVLNKNRYCSSE